MSAVQVLQVVVGGKNFNGIVSFLYQFYKNIDQEKVHFDFFVIRENAFELKKDDPVFKDSQFYVLNAVKKNNKTDHRKMMKGLREVLQTHHYDFVHINTLNIGAQAPLIYVCKKQKVPVTISHSHNDYAKTISFTKLAAHKVLQPYIAKNADHLFACSRTSGACLFGEKGVAKDKFRVINNAIDPDIFSYSEETRNRVREAFGIAPDTFLVGQIGRLAKQKNQEFALEVFQAFHREKPDSRFWIVGKGEDQEKLEEKTKELGLSDSVVFLGQRDDVPDLLNAMDVFLFPSLWEGLGIAAVEAQATGIHVLASDQVSKEAAVTDLIRYLPLSEGAQKWAEELVSMANDGTARKDRREDLRKAGFTIREEAKKLERFYCSEKR
uniref:Glycosyl transferase group 1 n=1 Tax=uncultured bacterium Contig248 TaxID=1393544 RepID=W0FM50_9BACT|nr:glycosyl transferase group 1 [uncultured bacterium Contig248]